MDADVGDQLALDVTGEDTMMVLPQPVPFMHFSMPLMTRRLLSREHVPLSPRPERTSPRPSSAPVNPAVHGREALPHWISRDRTPINDGPHVSATRLSAMGRATLATRRIRDKIGPPASSSASGAIALVQLRLTRHEEGVIA